jgi:hypothetical protein
VVAVVVAQVQLDKTARREQMPKAATAVVVLRQALQGHQSPVAVVVAQVHGLLNLQR